MSLFLSAIALGIIYKWIAFSSLHLFLSLSIFGLLGTSYAKEWTLSGNVEVWPFLKAEHFTKAKEEHGYLGKEKTIRWQCKQR